MALQRCRLAAPTKARSCPYCAKIGMAFPTLLNTSIDLPTTYHPYADQELLQRACCVGLPAWKPGAFCGLPRPCSFDGSPKTMGGQDHHHRRRKNPQGRPWSGPRLQESGQFIALALDLLWDFFMLQAGKIKLFKEQFRRCQASPWRKAREGALRAPSCREADHIGQFCHGKRQKRMTPNR